MHHLVARHIRAVSVVIDEFDNFPHAADYTLLKSGSESKDENDHSAVVEMDERRNRDQKIRERLHFGNWRESIRLHISTSSRINLMELATNLKGYQD